MPLPVLPSKRLIHRRFLTVFALLALTTGCAQVPELDESVPDNLDNAAYPALISLDGSLVTQTLPSDAASQIDDNLAGRRERLQARAKRLNSPVVDPESRARMKAGISR